MQIITHQTEKHLSEMLPGIERQPDAWIFIHVNISPIHDQILEKEGISRLSLAKIHKMSLHLAEKLNALGLSECDGSILVFEDSDVLALVSKKPGIMPEILERLHQEFARSGMMHALVIEEMEEKLTQLVTLAEEKKGTAIEYSIKHRAAEVGEKLMGWTQPDPAITRAIFEKRRSRQPSCVLIIEDDALTRGLVASTLKDDHQIVQAKDAESGIIGYIDHAPDIVFLDIHLPGLSGRDVLKRLIQLDPKAYVVMLSADSSAENVVSTHTEGAVGFIRKPFSKEKLLKYIEQYPSLRSDAATRALEWNRMKDNKT